jgi:hypothetical protein
MVPLKRCVHVLFPRTCKYYLNGKKNVIEVSIARKRAYSGLSTWTLHAIRENFQRKEKVAI